MEEFHQQRSETFNVRKFIDGEPFYVGRTTDKISIVFVTPKIKAYVYLLCIYLIIIINLNLISQIYII